MKHLLNIKPHLFFRIAAILFGILHLIFTPPYQSPDEFNHFYRAWQISEGGFLPEKQDNRIGGDIPNGVDNFMVPFRVIANNRERAASIDDITAGFSIYAGTKSNFRDFPNTANYAPLCYAPQAFALWLLRTLGCSLTLIYFGGKIAALLFYIWATGLAIKITPVCKWLFAALLLLPMAVNIAASYSADTVTNVFAILFISIILKLKDVPALSNRAIIALFVFSALLALAKTVYLPLTVMLFIIPATAFGSVRKKYLILAPVILVSIIIAWGWATLIKEYYITYNDYHPDFRIGATLHPQANYPEQVKYLASHPWYAFTAVISTLTYNPAFYLNSFVGEFGIYMGVKLPQWVVVLTLFSLVLLAGNEINRLKGWHRFVFLVAAFASLAALILSQYAFWNAVGGGPVDQLQGRYLIPVVPVILLAISFRSQWAHYAPILTLGIVIIAQTSAANALYQSYFGFSRNVYTEFQTSFENTAVGAATVEMDRGAITTGGRNNSSALTLPPHTAGYRVHFSGLGYGDLVEIDLWKKGDSAQIGFTGSGSDCAPYEFFNRQPLLTDDSGWNRLNMTFTVFIPGSCSSGHFYLDNPGSDTTRFDDLRFRITKLSTSSEN